MQEEKVTSKTVQVADYRNFYEWKRSFRYRQILIEQDRLFHIGQKFTITTHKPEYIP